MNKFTSAVITMAGVVFIFNNDRIPIADAHCDLLHRRHMGESGFDVTADSLSAGGVRLQVLAAFANSARTGERTAAVYREQVLDFADAAEAIGLRGWDGHSPLVDGCAVLVVEGCEAFAGSIETASEYIAAGARLFALTWNHENELAFPHTMRGGLKPFGREVLKLLNGEKAAADVSHLNEDGFWQVIDLAEDVCASHSNCRALCGHSRNLTDAQIKAIIAKKGFVGVNFYPAFLRDEAGANIGDIAGHVRHILELGGENAVGFGSDFDGIEVKTAGMESPAAFPGLLDELRRGGVGERLLRKIAFDNFAGFIKRMGG